MYTVAQDLQIHVNGLSVSYVDEGTGLVPFICIHGFPFDKSSWQYQIDGLKQQNRILAYDLRGFGKSESNGWALSMDLFADDLVGFMDALKIDKAIVCGMSMGGYVVFNALKRYPERFAAAVLCNTQCIADSDEARQKRFQTINSIKAGEKEAFADAFLQKVFTPESFSSKKALVEATKEVIMNTSDISIINTLYALAERDDSRAVLKEVAVPVLVLCGSDDQTIPKEQSFVLDSELPISTLHVIEGASHMVQLVQAEVFNRYVGEFVGKFKLISSIE